MRRKQGHLVPLEVSVLEAALDLLRRGTPAFHGYSLAKVLQADGDRQLLTAYGTLYRALHRLEKADLVESFWEDAHLAEAEGRPRRRLYRVTARAEPAVKRHRALERAGLRSLDPGLETP